MATGVETQFTKPCVESAGPTDCELALVIGGDGTILRAAELTHGTSVPLLRTVDQYGVERKDRIKTEIIFLSGDKIEGAQRIDEMARQRGMGGDLNT